MKLKLYLVLLVSFTVFHTSSAQSDDTGRGQMSDSVYMFCYFKGNGDGLHLAYSNDGYSWKALFNDSIILRPTVSKDKLMRDPCMIRGRDGKFHGVDS